MFFECRVLGVILGSIFSMGKVVVWEVGYLRGLFLCRGIKGVSFRFIL